jgi:hypothetical protein
MSRSSRIGSENHARQSGREIRSRPESTKAIASPQQLDLAFEHPTGFIQSNPVHFRPEVAEDILLFVAVTEVEDRPVDELKLLFAFMQPPN